MEWALTIPDELATRLRPVGERLPQILELGLRELHAAPGTFAGLADVLEALAGLPSPQEVLALRPSPALEERVDTLLGKNRQSGLSDAERLEWQQFQYVEHLVRIAKAQASTSSTPWATCTLMANSRRPICTSSPPRTASERAQDTIATRMCQLAIGYWDSPLSATYLQEGLQAGDRVPDLPVRYHSEGGAGWQERTLFRLLDPSRFTLLAVRSAESGAAPADLYDAVQPWRPLIGVVELAPAAEAARERFQAVFGRSNGVFLVRPDGYVGFASGEDAWTRQLDADCRLWLSAPAQVHTHDQ
jgi:hypothetical protein